MSLFAKNDVGTLGALIAGLSVSAGVVCGTGTLPGKMTDLIALVTDLLPEAWTVSGKMTESTTRVAPAACGTAHLLRGHGGAIMAGGCSIVGGRVLCGRGRHLVAVAGDVAASSALITLGGGSGRRAAASEMAHLSAVEALDWIGIGEGALAGDMSHLATFVAVFINTVGLTVTGEVSCHLAVIANCCPRAIAGKVVHISTVIASLTSKIHLSKSSLALHKR